MLSLRLFRRLGSQSVATSKTIGRAHLWSHNPRSLVSSSAHFSTSIRRRSDNRYNLASPKNDIVKEDPETTTSQALPGRAEPRLSLTFTCTVTDCGERSTHEFSKRAYTKGIVLVQCPKCKNRWVLFCIVSFLLFKDFFFLYRHLIADHLGWFKDSTKDGKLRTVEDIVRERGETVKKGRLTVGGDIEYLP